MNPDDVHFIMNGVGIHVLPKGRGGMQANQQPKKTSVNSRWIELKQFASQHKVRLDQLNPKITKATFGEAMRNAANKNARFRRFKTRIKNADTRVDNRARQR